MWKKERDKLTVEERYRERQSETERQIDTDTDRYRQRQSETEREPERTIMLPTLGERSDFGILEKSG